MNPLLINIDKKLNVIYIQHNSTKTTAIPYADDITIIVTQPEEIDTIKETLHDYMHANVAHINVNKSRATALGSWNKSTPIIDIKYHNDITLLGFNMTRNIKESATKSWAMLPAKIRARVQEAYHRALILEHRIHCSQHKSPPYRFCPTDKHSNIMVPMEKRNLQSPVIHVTTAK